MKRISIKIFVVVFSLSLLSACGLGKEADPKEYPVELTENEKNHPLAKYYYNVTKPNDEHIASLKYVEPEKGLPLSDISKMLEPGYLDLENGYTIFEDGSGYVATNVKFPGASGEMLDWWFDWHGYDIMRYKIWYPGLHAIALYESYEEPDTFSISKYVLENPEGKTNHTIETLMKGGALQDLQITFVNPAQYGLDNSQLGKDQWAVCANVKSGKHIVVQMVHFVRNTEDGVEMRSRFWVGKELPKVARKLFIKKEDLYDLAHHCVSEYTQLASFLPEVYNTYSKK